MHAAALPFIMRPGPGALQIASTGVESPAMTEDTTDLRPEDETQPAAEKKKLARIDTSNLSGMLRYLGARAAEKKLTQVASSLTFTTVLATVPMLAVVLSLFTAFPLFSEFRSALEAFLADGLMPPAVSENVMRYLNLFAAQASRLTAIGSLFLFVTSISLIMTIDQAFNNIWQVRQQRPLRQRMLVYWAILSLGPLLVGASLWATALLARESLGRIGDLPAIVSFALSFVPVVVAGLALAALFVSVPNRHVKWRDALVGGMFTSIVLEIMKAGFAYYLTRFPSYTVIYGAFATLPIFLMWIYLSWLAVLAGATITATLPSLRQRHWLSAARPGDGFLDAIAVLSLLWQAQQRQQPGRGLQSLADELQCDTNVLGGILDTLKRLGYVMDSPEKNDDRWFLSCDPAQIGVTPIIDTLLLDSRRARGMLPAVPLNELLAHELAPHGEPEYTLAEWFTGPATAGLLSQVDTYKADRPVRSRAIDAK